MSVEVMEFSSPDTVESLRAECERLRTALRVADEVRNDAVRASARDLEARRTADAALKVDGNTSDGYHTFNELYEHRITLFIALCAEIDARTPTGFVWRSKLHSDGSAFDGWFVMGIGTEPGQQITYHLPLSRWADTDWLGTECPRAPGFDGHTGADVLQRLRRYFR